MAAYWSLAEVLRRGAKRLLDIDPQELVFGLHPQGQGSMTVFLADALDNGAGYAAESASRTTSRAPQSTRMALTSDWDDKPHAACSSSCLDCLRSYDNRRLHGAWTGGSPSTCWTSGRPALVTSRWFEPWHSDGARCASTALMSLEAGQTDGGVPFVTSATTRKAVLLGHPLWQRNEDYAVEEQILATDELADTLGANGTIQSDVFEALRRPLSLLRWLM